jgi:branched-chain amino acid aminotransferase
VGQRPSRVVSKDGVLLRPEDAVVSVYDRGFLYGDSVFETIRTYGGRPFALEEHLGRLTRSAERVGIVPPVDEATFAREIALALAAVENAESTVRVMLTRGTGPLGLDPNLALTPLRVMLIEPLVPLPAALYREGVAVITHRTERAADDAPGAKVGNYLGGLLALRAAKAVGAHEAILLDARGGVIEGTTSNLFRALAWACGRTRRPWLRHAVLVDGLGEVRGEAGAEGDQHRQARDGAPRGSAPGRVSAM